jgi:hypothetical protein
MKFSGQGFPLWTNRYDSGFADYPSALAVDTEGNIYIAGSGPELVKYADLLFYTPPNNFTGTDTINYTVTDKLGNQATTNLSILVTPGNFALTVSSPTNLTPAGLNLSVDTTPATTPLIIETSTDLINWQPIQTNSAINGSVDLLDSSATNHPLQFYRAVIQSFTPVP